MGRLYDAYVEVGARLNPGDLKKQGEKAGKEYGERLAAAATKAAEARIAKLGEALGKARLAEADAAGKVRVAEAKLNEVRDKFGATSARAIAAEEGLAAAQRKSATAGDAAKVAAQSLEKARDKAAKTAQASGEEAGRKFGTGLKDAMSKVKTDSEGKAAGDRFGIGFSKRIPAIGGRVTSFFKTGIGAAAGLAAGAVVGGSFLAGFQEALAQGDTRAKLQAQLGLSDADTATAGKAAADLYKGAFGDSLGGVNDAIRRVVQDTGTSLNSVDLKPITGKVLSLASTFDVDLGGTTRAVGQLMRNGLAKNATQALDIVTAGFQGGVDKSDDFLDTLNEYGPQFRKLGLDGTTATGLLSQGLKGGARDADTVADALKEFSIRAVDGSKTTSAGFKSLGLDADKMAQRIAKGGKPASDGLQLVLDRLRKIKDPVKQSQVAVELFGTKAEDLGKSLFSLDPKHAVGALGQVAGAADKLTKTVGTTPQQAITGFFRTIKQNSVDGLGSVIKGFQDGKVSAEGFPGVMQNIGVKTREAFTYFKTDVMPRLREFAGFLKAEVLPRVVEFGGFIRDNILPPLRQFGSYIVDTVAPIVGQFIKGHLAGLKEGFASVQQAVRDNKPELDKIFGVLQTVAKFIVEQVSPVLGKLANQYFPAIGTAISAVITVIGYLVKAIEGIIGTARTILSAVWETFSGFFQLLLDGAGKAFGWIPGIGDKLKTAASEFKTFRDDVNGKLAGINNKTVTVALTLQDKINAKQVSKAVQNNLDRRGISVYEYGGSVTGGIPGKDSVHGLLMPGEHVLDTGDVKAMGGQQAVYRFRDQLHKFENGGAVSFNVNSKIRNPDAADTAVGKANAYISRTAQSIGSAVKAALTPFSAGNAPSGPPGAAQSFRGQTLNARTIQMLLSAESTLGRHFRIMQGSYSTRVSASGGTHAGGGAMDTDGPGGWNRAVSALRGAGFASWHRTPAQGPWGHHIHSIAIGDSSASPSAKAQVKSFLRGGDGLGGGMALGGAVLPVKKYDTGGPWPPGTFGYNGTGKTETVRTDSQEADLKRPLNVRVFIGDQELRGMVRVEVDDKFRDDANSFNI